MTLGYKKPKSAKRHLTGSGLGNLQIKEIQERNDGKI